MIPVSFKVEKRQFKLLNKLALETNIPKSVLIRQGIDLLLLRSKEEVMTPGLRREIEALLAEDQQVLKRLAE